MAQDAQRRPGKPGRLTCINEVVHRAHTEMPDWYMPSAVGVVIAGGHILPAAAASPLGWSRRASGIKRRVDNQHTLWVQRCGKYWIIERACNLDASYVEEQALTLSFGPLPVWAPTSDGAMR